MAAVSLLSSTLGRLCSTMKKILIIDDDEYDRRTIKYALKKQGDNYEFYEANNGKQGCKMAKDITPDITLLDLRMPLMDGFQTLACIRNSAACKQTKIFIFTGSDDEDEYNTALKNGANDFITKPSNLAGYQDIASSLDDELNS